MSAEGGMRPRLRFLWYVIGIELIDKWGFGEFNCRMLMVPLLLKIWKETNTSLRAAG